MPRFCAVVGCGSRSNRDNKNFFFFPRVKHTQGCNREKRRLWVAALRRADFTEKHLRTAYICSDHFVTGQPSTDPNHTDYVPTVRMGYDEKQSMYSKMTQYEKANRKKWKQEVGMDVVSSEICSKHFVKEDFLIKSEKSRLKPNAVPSIFPWTPTNITNTEHSQQMQMSASTSTSTYQTTSAPIEEVDVSLYSTKASSSIPFATTDQQKDEQPGESSRDTMAEMKGGEEVMNQNSGPCEMEEQETSDVSTVAYKTSTFGKQGLVLHSQAREIVANVIDFMKTEAEHFRRYNKPLIPMTHFRERVLAATKIATKTYTSVTKEAKDVASGVSTSFTSPKRKRTLTKDNELVENEKHEIRAIIVNEFHVTEKQSLTLDDGDINIKNEYRQHEENPNVDAHENVCKKVVIKEENDEIEEPNFIKTELEDSSFFDISGNHSKNYTNRSTNGSYLNIKVENIEHEETEDTSVQENYWMKEEIKEKIEIEEHSILGP